MACGALSARTRLALALPLLVADVAAHGSMFYPPPRNSFDRHLPQFAGGRAPLSSCNCGDAKAGCDEGIRDVGGGQPCLWFSQGCSIGCAACTGVGSHANVSLCGSTMQPTLPKHAWTMNLGAAEGSADDSYRHSPWRAPGSAPTFDACGRAGGTSFANAGPGDAVYWNNSNASFGDLGSQALGPAPSGTVWTAGSAVEVAWGIRFNHGGGYQYRLCPASEPPTEACFARTPLEFVREKHALRWNNGTTLRIEGVFVDTGTRPAGSTWARNPIPRINFDSHSSGQPASASGCSEHPAPATGAACRQFAPPCPADDGWYTQPGAAATNPLDVMGECSGDWTGGLIVDEVIVPAGLAPGEYVVGWRWDCEESTQVWSSCADVTVVAA